MNSVRSFAACIVLATSLLFGISAHSANPAASAQQKSDTPAFISKPWTGDLDAMEKRRMIRALTVFSKTYYFIDKGQPRGIVYDAMKQFEDDLNKKLKTKTSQWMTSTN